MHIHMCIRVKVNIVHTEPLWQPRQPKSSTAILGRCCGHSRYSNLALAGEPNFLMQLPMKLCSYLPRRLLGYRCYQAPTPTPKP